MLTLDKIVAAVEESYGEVFDSEEQCPGVYYLACRPLDKYFADELVVVEQDCPHISAAAKAYGQPLDGHDELIVYDFDDPYGGRPVVLYEADRYRMLHKQPIPDGEDLLGAAAYYADDYPEYFSPISAPIQTPRGYMTRYLTLANGIFALETNAGARLIAIAGVIWSLELYDTTKQLGMIVQNPADIETPVEVQYLFFTEQDGCLALFELLHEYKALRKNERLDAAALMNAIWSYHPEYALEHNLREQRGLNDMLGLILNAAGAEVELSGSEKNMVAMSAEAGTEYVRW